MPENTDLVIRRDLPLQLREARIVPSSWNEQKRTIDVVWTTGARVRRYDFWTDTPYEEELVVSSEAVDMSRFDAGAVQVLDNHRAYGGIAAILGIAERGWIDNGEGLATIRLSEREEIAGLVRDIQTGIIRTISVGYSVQRYAQIRAQDRTDGGNVALYRAERWTPSEISFVTVPADAQAGTRANPSQALAPCEFIRAEARTTQEHSEMPQIENVGGASATPANQNIGAAETRSASDQAATQQAAVSAAVAAATQRSADITALCVRHGVPHLADQFIRSDKSVDQAGRAILDELARNDAASGGHVNAGSVRTTGDELQTRMEGWAEAIHHRVDARVKLTDNGRQFRGMSLLEMGRDWLESRGINTRGMDRMALASRLMQFRSLNDGFQFRDGFGGMTTSDFGNVLANVASKRLRAGYDENPGTYTRWARRAPNAPDFKTMSVVQLSAMPDLLKVNEHGEFKYGSLSDGAESYALLTYGRIVSFSRQLLVNDDLRAFDRVVTGFGASANRLENRTVYAQITSNPTLSDTIALFNAAHGNLDAGAPSALQLSALTTARTKMRVQKGLQSEELNVIPSTLIVPAALEQTAYQLTSSQYTPATQGTISEFRSGGRTALDPVVEPILDANSATAWYLAASNSQVDTVEYCWLDGAEGPVLESEMGFEVDGISFKCREDFAAKVLDFRGLYKSAGA